MTTDGRCPVCNRPIDVVRTSSPDDGSRAKSTGHAPTLGELSKMSGEKAPWHFKLLMAMLVAYLAWRVIAVFVD